MKKAIALLSFVFGVVFHCLAQSANEHYTNALEAYSTKNFSKALAEVNLAIVKKSERTSLVLRAKINFELKKYRESLNDLESSSNAKVRNNIKEKIQVLADFNSNQSKLNDQDLEILYYTGAANYYIKDNVKATISLTKYIENNQSNGHVYYYRALSYMAMEQFGSAEFDLEKCLLLKPLEYEYHSQMGICLALNNKLELSLSFFSKSIQLNPGNAELYFRRGIVYSDLQQENKAYVDFKKASELDPTFTEALENLGEIEIKRKDYPKAEITYSLLIDKVSNSSNYYRLAQSFYYQKKYKKAIENYTKGLELAPDSVESYYRIGKSYLKINEFKNSISAFEKFIENTNSESRWEALNFCSWAIADNDTFTVDLLSKSEEWIQESLKLFTCYDNTFTYGFLQSKKGEKDRAISTLKHAIKLAKVEKEDYSEAESLLLKLEAAKPITSIAVRNTTLNEPVVDNSSKVELPNIYAVVVGVSKYQNNKYNLKYADADARLYYDFLRSHFGGSTPLSNITILLNANATRASIIKALNTQFKNAFENDIVIVYFACHGMQSPQGNEFYLEGSDADAENIEGTGVSYTDVKNAMGKCSSKKKMVLLDACYSGAFGIDNSGMRGEEDIERSMIANRLLKNIASYDKTAFYLTASSAGETSRESEEWGGGHGVFTYYLVKGLNGEADDNGNGIVDVRELYEYVRKTVSIATKNKQFPELKGNFQDRFPLSVIRSTR